MRDPRRQGRLGAALLATVAAALIVAAPASADATWRLEQPPPPPGAVFKEPIGAPGDIQCLQRNRCLLMNEGNSAVQQGIYVWNGAGWRLYSTVCGAPAGVGRIAFGGPDEFWTVTAPSLPRTGVGQALCHIQNGKVTGSFSTPLQSSDPYRQMDAAACNSANDCWFGGPGAVDASGGRKGAFHLHWNGSSLTTDYGFDGRGVTDLQAFGGTFWEGVVQGRAASDTQTDADPYRPPMLHRIAGGAFSGDPFTASPGPGTPPEGADILALDSNGTDLWAAGGFTASGTAAHPDTGPHRGPLLLHWVGGQWQEVVLDPLLFGPDDRFVDVASVPGTSDAWVAVQPYSQRGATNATATVALVHADGTASLTTLPASGAGRGIAAKVEFTAPNDGWMVTNAGWIFHYTDGDAVPVDTDPAYQGTITFRPNEAASQFVPDKPPPDDNAILAPPPPPTTTGGAGDQTAPAKRLPAAIRKVKSKLVGRTKLVLTFIVVRPVRVALLGYRKRKRKNVLVAKTKTKTFDKPGKKGRLVLRVNPHRYPTKLKLNLKETTDTGATDGGESGSNSGDTVTT